RRHAPLDRGDGGRHPQPACPPRGAAPPAGPEAVSLVLASASASRAAMLRQAGLDFEIRPARVDEEEIKLSLKAEGATPRQVAEALAELKAQRASRDDSDSFIIGADQMLACEGLWYDKPADMAQARAQLQALRGKTHELTSAVVV